MPSATGTPSADHVPVASTCRRVVRIPEQPLEPLRRQLGVSNRVLNGLVAEIALDRAGIDAIVSQLVAAGMTQHVRVHLELELCLLAGPLDQGLKASAGERHATLTDKDEWMTFGSRAVAYAAP